MAVNAGRWVEETEKNPSDSELQEDKRMGRVDIRLRREHRLVVVIVSARKVVRRIVLTFERDFSITTPGHFLAPEYDNHALLKSMAPAIRTPVSHRVALSHEGLVVRFASVPLP